MRDKYAKVAVAADSKALVSFLALAGLVMFLPYVLKIQWLTGPIVNAVLIIALFLAGIRSALFLAVIPSLMALSGGLLPAVLSPAVPFIVVGNMILVIAVDRSYESFKSSRAGYWFGVLAGATLEFIFLFSSLGLVSGLLAESGLAAKAAPMLSWPQFATALAGGLIAWPILRWLKRF